jgi:hypothetical protein
VTGLENVQRLFFEEDLLVRGEIGGNSRGGIIGDVEDFLGQRLRNEVSAFRFLYTVRRESGEFRIVGGVIAAVGNEENLSLAGGTGEALDVRKQALGAGDIELAAGEHEIGLGIDFPEDGFVGGHETPLAWSRRARGFVNAGRNSWRLKVILRCQNDRAMNFIIGIEIIYD